jgi:hypothetical protein
MAKIIYVHGREVLDSRGNPTVEVEVKLDDGTYKQPVNNKITFDDVGYINANAEQSAKTKTHYLTFNVPIDSDTILATEINLDVVFVQDEPVVN